MASRKPQNSVCQNVSRTMKRVLPCQTSHFQSPLDTVDYGGQDPMISAAGLKERVRKVLDRTEETLKSKKGLITRKESELADRSTML